MGQIARLLFRLSGWRQEGQLPDHYRHVVVSAPHTSMFDFIIGRLFYAANDIPSKFFIKKELFFFPLGFILRKLGGIPVDRGKNNSLIPEAVKQFETHECFLLTITPEGTRKPTARWNKGFYYIARKAHVPILLSYFDYKYKTVGIGDIFMPSDEPDADMRRVQLFYKDIHAKHPEKFVVAV